MLTLNRGATIDPEINTLALSGLVFLFLKTIMLLKKLTILLNHLHSVVIPPSLNGGRAKYILTSLTLMMSYGTYLRMALTWMSMVLGLLKIQNILHHLKRKCIDNITE